VLRVSLQLLDWAQRSGSWVIEDDYDSEYRYGSLPIASLQGLDSNSRVIYIGTFSKVLFPSLRIGYVVIPPDLVDRFIMVRQALDLTPPHLYQAVLTDFIREGHFARHIRRLRLVMASAELRLSTAYAKSLGLLSKCSDQKPVCISPSRCPQDSAIRRLRRGPHTKNFGFGRFRLPMRARLPDRDSFWGFGGTTAAEMPDAVRHLKKVLTADPRPTSQN